MLKLENLSKYYYSSSSVTCALRRINLEFNVGEFIAITGESGSGKTTLLNIISGLDSYEEGELYYNGKKTSYFDDSDWEQYRKEQIAFIFQNYNLIDSYSVLENVMVAYIIDGYSFKEAKAKAKGVLKFVGLQNDMHKKATKLSGGQKQRLAIARALAKDSQIIVADEPTGNLDAENGVAILELLKKVSKDKLVIVVTHNQGQIEPFITRRIRLHDGEVVSDETIKVNENLTTEIAESKKNNNEKEINRIFNFSFLNIKSQPKKGLLLLFLVFISTLSSFVFFANFKMNLDDNKTKELDTKIFTNLDDTRVLVRKNDSSVITQEMLDEVMVEEVESVEKYDYITDCNYYRIGDYYTKLTGGWTDPDPNTGVSQFIDGSSIILKEHDKFMRSYYSLKESDLSVGRLPTNDYEMVVYSKDTSILNTFEKVLFRNEKRWAIGSYYQYDFKIVGILKRPTEQAYFSDNICRMMELSQYDIKTTITYQIQVSPFQIRKYNVNFNRVAVDPNIGDYDMSFSENVRRSLEKSIVNNERNTTIRYDSIVMYETYNFNKKTAQKVSDDAVGISQEFFDYIYETYKNKKQFAIFLTDYAYLDDVKKELSKLGYDSLSCFQSAVSGYDVDKVIVRYVNLVVSILALALINVLCVLLGYTILKVKKNDYVIFKMIGMTNSMCKKVNYVEVVAYSIVSTILLIIVSTIVKYSVTNSYIIDVYKYIKWYDYLIVFAIMLFSMAMLGKRYAKFITNKAKVTVLKEVE